jgi:spermidine/putrescine transport system ATP-binding protein
MTQFVVEMRQVTKRFPNPGGGEVNAVDDVTLQINQGEFFSLLGPSGCGKTTSLRMIAGFEYPTQGEILINGQALGRTPPFRRPVNTVFQNYALFQHMTVFQNVAFGLEMEKLPKDEIFRRVAAALAMVQLNGMERRRPRQLSGGQQQRVALARALVKRPAVLLLDEPLGALDQKLRKEMQLELKGLQIQVGITFIYVTHDQEEALTMSDRMAVMNRGKILQLGTPVEVYERPANRFVADFIGETNFFPGVICALEKERATIRLQDLNAELSALLEGDLHLGQQVVLSVRPEKIRLSAEPALPQNSLPARVDKTAYVGSDTRVVIYLGGGLQVNVWEQNKISTLDPKAYYRRDQEVWANILPENISVLPSD